MPAKRRNLKRRLDESTELEAWELMFAAGADYFANLPEIGVAVDGDGKPDRDTAEEVWHRLGARFLAEKADPRLGMPWAQRQFGDPHAR